MLGRAPAEKPAPNLHVLVTFATEEAARRVIDPLAREGIPVSQLHVEHFGLRTPRRPRRYMWLIAAVMLVGGCIAGWLVASDAAVAAPAFGAYTGILGARLGFTLDRCRVRRFERRRHALGRRAYRVTCPAITLTEAER